MIRNYPSPWIVLLRAIENDYNLKCSTNRAHPDINVAQEGVICF